MMRKVRNILILTSKKLTCNVAVGAGHKMPWQQQRQLLPSDALLLEEDRVHEVELVLQPEVPDLRTAGVMSPTPAVPSGPYLLANRRTLLSAFLMCLTRPTLANLFNASES